MSALRRTAANAAPGEGTPPIVHEVLGSPGQPLDAATRALMEPRFGHDLTRVRLHTDARAVASARAVNARAFTIGSDVVFGAGQYAPESSYGQRLLAHELAHVIQQSRGGPAPPLDSRASHEQSANQAAAAFAGTSGPVPVQGATGAGMARDGPSLPAVTAKELLDRLVLAVRGFASSPPGVPEFDPAATGAAIGKGYQTYAAIQLIDGQGNQILTGIGAYLGGGAEHGEAQAIAALRRALPPGTNLAGARMMVVVDQVPCAGCASALEAFAAEIGIKQMDVYVPTRPRLYPPGVTPPENPPMTGPKQTARTFTRVGCEADICLVTSRTLSGAPSPAPGGAATAEPLPQAPTKPPAAGTGTTPEGAPATPAATPSTSSARVRTDVRVVSSLERPGGTVVSELEITLGEGLEQLNKAAPEAGKLPSRIVLKITQGADGAVTGAESLTGQPGALAEAFARQIVPRGSQGLAGETEGAGRGAAGATRGASRGMTILFRGVKIGGWAVFSIVTGYQLIKATSSERPRVLASAGGGLVGGIAGTYLVCNVVLGIETLGWSLLLCGFIAGGAGGYAGSKVAEGIYDEATMTELDRALQEAEKQPLNVRLLLYAMISGYGREGVPVTAGFVREFINSVPANLKEYELYILASQLHPSGGGDTTESILKQLRAAILKLPERAPRLLPPLLNTQDVLESYRARGIGLETELQPGFAFGPKGPGRIILFPGHGLPRLGTPDQVGDVSPLIRIDLNR